MTRSNMNRLWHILIAFMLSINLALAHDHDHEERQDRQAASTTVVAVTATTTVTQTATTSGDANGACSNFYGACVVYGGYGSASYTTTVYAASPASTWTTQTPTSIYTSYSTATQVVVQTTTVNNSDACRNYNGACVVYDTAGSAAATTVYSGSSGSDGRPGNSGGYIGLKGSSDNDGVIGAASALDKRWAVLGALLTVTLSPVVLL